MDWDELLWRTECRLGMYVGRPRYHRAFAMVTRFDLARGTLPAWARWRTLRQTAWHLAGAESRYYLPALELPARPRRGRPPRFSGGWPGTNAPN